MATNGGNAHTRAARALDRILQRPKQALLGWQKSDTEIVISAPGGLGRVYITWPESGTRDTAVNRRGVPLAGRLPILVVPGAPNVIVDIDSSDMAAVAAVFNDVYGTLPHPFASHTDVPSSYTGEAGKALVVNAGENGAEWRAIPREFTPASATAPGVKGDFTYDADALYLCVATDTWIKFNKDTF